MRRWRTDGLALRLIAALLFGTIAAVSLTVRADLQPAIPAGFSADGLRRVGDYFKNEVATGRIPGAVVLILRHGRAVYSEAFGLRDVANQAPMTLDTIFRLYSMSKPITSVAVMMLVNDGKIALSDPLSKYIPAFAEVKVGVVAEPWLGEPTLKLEALQRPVTIEDLLRHTSGITYGFYGESPVRKLYASSNLFEGDFDNAQFVERLARLPLAEQPETLWDYGHSTDVLGRLVEVVSGKSLYQFEKERILDPLSMADTGFSVPDAQRSRVAEFLPNDRFKGRVAGLGDPVLPRRWESGGAGMVGTAADYARFAQMLLEGGTLDGKHYLKPDTVRLMISDHIGKEIGRDAYYFPGSDSGFGLGVAVRTAATDHLPAGEYRWDGVGGTIFFVDPRDDMLAIVMMQSPSQRARIDKEAKQLIYQAMER